MVLISDEEGVAALDDMREKVRRIGRMIVQLREAKGWTQGQLAEYSDVKRSWLSRVETGKLGLKEGPDIARLLRVARKLGGDAADKVMQILGIREADLLTEHPELFAPDVVEVALWLQRLPDEHRNGMLRVLVALREVAEVLARQYPEAEPPTPLPPRRGPRP